MNEIGEDRVYFQGVPRPAMPPDPIPFHLIFYTFCTVTRGRRSSILKSLRA